MLWCNGSLRCASETRIAPDDRGFTLGDGLFETLRVHRGDILHAHRHLRRLRHGAALLGIPLDADDSTLIRALSQTLEANALEDGSLRLTLTRGPAERGIATPAASRPTLLISASVQAPPAHPATLVVARTTRRNEFSPLSRIKSLNYLDNILARREAEQQGADDALLLNTRDRLAGSTVGNLIVLLDGVLLTPPVEDGALPGITRGLLTEGGLLTVKSLDLDHLRQAGTLLLCNSLGIRPVASLNGRLLSVRPGLVEELSAFLVSRP